MSRVWSARPTTVRSSQRLRVQTTRANDRFMAERAFFGAEDSVVFPKCPYICGVVSGLFMRWFLARARKKDSTNALHESSMFSPQIQGYHRLAGNQICGG